MKETERTIRTRFLKAKYKALADVLEDPPPERNFEDMNDETQLDQDKEMESLLKMAEKHALGKYDEKIRKLRAELVRVVPASCT